MRVMTGWRLVLALLIAVSTALLFTTGARMRILEGADDEVCSVGREHSKRDGSTRRAAIDSVFRAGGEAAIDLRHAPAGERSEPVRRLGDDPGAIDTRARSPPAIAAGAW